MKEQLFEGESIITTSKNGEIVLTNRRVRKLTKKRGSAELTSIFLEKISSIEVNYKSYWLFLLLGILLLTFAAFTAVMVVFHNSSHVPPEALLAALFGIGFVLSYIFSRKHVVTISSDGGAKIVFETRGMSGDEVGRFVNLVEQSKERLK